MCGAYEWFLQAHAPLLRSLQQSGDELAWHPHFWRRADQNGTWVQEIADVDWQVAMLRRAHAAPLAAFPGPPRHVRTGGGYHHARPVQAPAHAASTDDHPSG